MPAPRTGRDSVATNASRGTENKRKSTTTPASSKDGKTPSKDGKTPRESTKSTGRISTVATETKEADLVKKLGIQKPVAYGVVDTNISNARRSSMADQYKEGELETAFVDKVKGGEIDWIKRTLAMCGRELLQSNFAGGIVKTSILYAAEKADLEMCKLLLRYGGRELLQVKNFKGRDAAYYAEKSGLDLSKASIEATVDCWNHRMLQPDANKAEGKGRQSETLEPSTPSPRGPRSPTLPVPQLRDETSTTSGGGSTTSSKGVPSKSASSSKSSSTTTTTSSSSKSTATKPASSKPPVGKRKSQVG
ncbi:unnamed protein product [Amoebophrya sp. A25]|nr:unnamed protein product [Amoebophrya sp. A25]|eukprot:GSA25T00008432001.1